jgi:hypothetical protein
MERDLQEEQMGHESQIENARAKKAKWEVAKLLLSEGIKENIKARTSDEEETEETKESDTPIPRKISRSKVTLVK